MSAAPVGAGTPTTVQLVPDPGFEDLATPPCFAPSAGDAAVRRTTRHPLDRAHSLAVRLGARAAITCAPGLAATAADVVHGILQLRNTGRAGDGTVRACLRVTLDDGQVRRGCESTGPRDQRRARLALDLFGATVT